ncbi:hypothetical protein JRO89_XS11G0082300 [Xanthoceras sorbifolium]|uniref:Thioredoxin domain-containing protein n=1 Tax=Xanthoceras sorbifolium TaxID=99658 RepID=A0ABQ8HF39_9ROSI|nr:hypothetical protein JRO89_XS11G0082300 [Xanthoceras sorbifolium]
MAASTKIGIGIGTVSTHHRVGMSTLSPLHPPHSLFLFNTFSARRRSLRLNPPASTQPLTLRLRASSVDEAQTTSDKGVENVVIIGSGPAGYTAAIYAARANLKPVVFEGYQVGGVPGGQLMTTTEVENFPGFPEGITGPDLMDRMRRQAERWGAELFQEDVEYIDVKNRPFTVKSSEHKGMLVTVVKLCHSLVLVHSTRQTMDGELEPADDVKCHSIVFATGATAKRLRLPREDEFWSRGISACAICDGASPLFKGQVLSVVGGGDTATEEALYLTKYARHVHLLVRRDQLRASKAMQDRYLISDIGIFWTVVIVISVGTWNYMVDYRECFRVFNNPNITVHFNTETVDIVSNMKGQMSGILVRKVDTGEESVLEAKGLFYGIGHSPNSQLLEGQVELESSGYVKVEEGTAKTSVQGVFAAGDVQDHEWRQAVTAAGSGCIAALSVERYLVNNDLLVEFHQGNSGRVTLGLSVLSLYGGRTGRPGGKLGLSVFGGRAGSAGSGGAKGEDDSSISDMLDSAAINGKNSLHKKYSVLNLKNRGKWPQTEEPKKDLTDRDVQEGFDITRTKHKGQYALRKLYHESPRLICVLYTAPTCGPCRTLKPILGQVIEEFDQNVHFVEIDIEEDPEIAEAAGIMGTPCVQFFKNKEMLRIVSGVKMKKEYKEFIEANK